MENKTNKEKSFLQKVFLLGGKFGDSGDHNDYIDIEIFFLESTHYMNQNPRLTMTLLHWVWTYGPLLSPSKLRRLIKEYPDIYQKEFLKYFIDFLEKKKLIHKNWEILRPYCKVSKNNTENISFIPPYFKPNAIKYLRPFSYVKNHCPELFYRMTGLDQVTSDIKAALSFRKFKSLYELSAFIGSPRNRVNEIYKRLVRYELIDNKN